METAIRELREETGLVPAQLDIVDGAELLEYSDKGNPSIRYFVATLRAGIDHAALTFTFDATELASVAWYRVDAVETFTQEQGRMKRARISILKQALAVLAKSQQTE